MTTTVLNHLLDEAEQEAQRVLSICNACRYCEGFCAVFPAMTRRLDFAQDDIHYLANLCHNCGACLHSCQYAPPHAFAVNVPQTLAKVRLRTYQTFAWPAQLGAVYRKNGLLFTFGLSFFLTACFLLAAVSTGGLWQNNGTSHFYAIFPHNTLALVFGAPFIISVVTLGISLRRFWGTIRHSTTPKAQLSTRDVVIAARNVGTLKYLDGGHNEGCNEANDRFTHVRRYFHHATMYGFTLCFAATSVATLYHYVLGWQAPYAYTSAPVLLGTLGGLGLIVGPAGLLWLNVRRHSLHGDAAQKPMDIAFITLLLGISSTGLALLGLRETVAMPALLCLHLGWVGALFLTLPYGKFVHGAYRSAALLKWAIEKRSPTQLKLGDG